MPSSSRCRRRCQTCCALSTQYVGDARHSLPSCIRCRRKTRVSCIVAHAWCISLGMRVRYAVARMRGVVRARRACAPLHVVGKAQRSTWCGARCIASSAAPILSCLIWRPRDTCRTRVRCHTSGPERLSLTGFRRLSSHVLYAQALYCLFFNFR